MSPYLVLYSCLKTLPLYTLRFLMMSLLHNDYITYRFCLIVLYIIATPFSTAAYIVIYYMYSMYCNYLLSKLYKVLVSYDISFTHSLTHTHTHTHTRTHAHTHTHSLTHSHLNLSPLLLSSDTTAGSRANSRCCHGDGLRGGRWGSARRRTSSR